MKKSRLILLSLLSAVAGSLSFVTYKRYLQDMTYAWRTVLNSSRIADTACGPIEFAEFGNGFPVLVVHGAGGGYDQGLAVANLQEGDFRCIAMSRFGYLRTPMPLNASPATQADAHAALLDTLEISEAAVIGVSAGGLSASYFAQKYPHRCKALILISAVSGPIKLRSPLRNLMYGVIYRSDFASWFAATITRPSSAPLFNVPGSVKAQLSLEDLNWLDEFIQTTLPASSRRTGMLADIEQIAEIHPVPAGEIEAPTLIVHAANDGTVPIEQAYHSHEQIQNSQLLEIPDGGHLLMGQHDLVKQQVLNFLLEHTTKPVRFSPDP